MKSPNKMKIFIVIANYYPEISNNLVKSTFEILSREGVKNCKKINVPGVFEIPTVIAKKIDNFDAFIALGGVIKGKTPHFKLISESTINALMQLSIAYKKPIGNGIITCLNKKQAIERSRLDKKNKGGEATRAVLAVLKL